VFTSSHIVISVRISKEPGCTKNINYFGFCKSSGGGHQMYFVDLPGYGYAKASKTDRESWKKSIANYFKSRDISVLRYVHSFNLFICILIC
jgi:GTP-binding protein EngB required for normal cell division